MSLSAEQGRAPSLKVDHASICASRLDDLRSAFALVGLTTDYGGPHANGGTHMALLGFDDGSYLELIAPLTPGGADDSPWGRMIAGNAGTCAWAIASQDIQAEATRLKHAGVPVEGPSPGSRKRSDGTVIRWQTEQVGTGGAGSVLPFMIQDETARNLRVKPSASVQGSGVNGISNVVIAVQDLDSSIALFRKAYDLPQPAMEVQQQFGAKLAKFDGTPVILATPLDNSGWLKQRLQAFGESPVAFLLGSSGDADKKFGFTAAEGTWFGKHVRWLPADKLNGVRLGAIQNE